MKDDAESSDKSCLVSTTVLCMSAVMFSGKSAEIKHLFMLDSKDFVEVLGGFLNFVSKALLQLIALKSVWLRIDLHAFVLFH